MTRRSGPQLLPPTVTLPDAPLIGAPHLQDALGVSRAVICLWQRRYVFPPFHRERWDSWTVTDAVAEWLQRYGVRVQRK